MFLYFPISYYPCLAYFPTLKLEIACASEMIAIFQSRLCHITEDVIFMVTGMKSSHLMLLLCVCNASEVLFSSH